MSNEKKSQEQELLEEFLTKTEKQIKELEAENKADGASTARISINNAMLLVHRNNLLWLTSMAVIRGLSMRIEKDLPF